MSGERGGPAPPLGVLGLLRRTLAVFFDRFNFLFPLAFLPMLAVAFLTWLIVPETFAPGAAPEPPLREMLGAGLVQVAAGFVVLGVSTLAGIDALSGRRRAVGDYVGATVRAFGPLVGLSLLLIVATGIGAALLVVPGLYVAARYLPVVPVIVHEQAGWRALGRTARLTEGYRWPLAGAILGYFAVAILIGLLIAALFGVAGALLGPAAAVPLQAAIDALGYAFGGVFCGVVYARLREIEARGPAPSPWGAR